MIFCLYRVTELEKQLRDVRLKVIELEAISKRQKLENQIIEKKLEDSLNSSTGSDYNPQMMMPGILSSSMVS